MVQKLDTIRSVHGNDSEIPGFYWHKKCTLIAGTHITAVDMATNKKNGIEDLVLTTRESCSYLRITKPTYFKYIREGRIKAIKAGKGWKVLKSELDRFLRGDH